MEGKKECSFKEYPNVISYECTKKIIEQMEKNICRINTNEIQGTGLFCKIPFPNKDKMLPVLITNNHIIDNKLLYSNDAKIKIDIKEETEMKEIEFKNRLIYTNKEYDITIIEIKENDKIKNYLELDDIIINDILNDINKNKEYINETIYIIQYCENKLSVSYGLLNDIYTKKKYNFIHKCNTKEGYSGSPILNLNNKLIGIHKEGNKKYQYNEGAFLNHAIKEFIKINYKNKDKNYNQKKSVNKRLTEIKIRSKTYISSKKFYRKKFREYSYDFSSNAKVICDNDNDGNEQIEMKINKNSLNMNNQSQYSRDKFLKKSIDKTKIKIHSDKTNIKLINNNNQNNFDNQFDYNKKLDDQNLKTKAGVGGVSIVGNKNKILNNNYQNNQIANCINLNSMNNYNLDLPHIKNKDLKKKMNFQNKSEKNETIKKIKQIVNNQNNYQHINNYNDIYNRKKIISAGRVTPNKSNSNTHSNESNINYKIIALDKKFNQRIKCLLSSIGYQNEYLLNTNNNSLNEIMSLNYEFQNSKLYNNISSNNMNTKNLFIQNNSNSNNFDNNINIIPIKKPDGSSNYWINNGNNLNRINNILSMNNNNKFNINDNYFNSNKINNSYLNNNISNIINNNNLNKNNMNYINNNMTNNNLNNNNMNYIYNNMTNNNLSNNNMNYNNMTNNNLNNNMNYFNDNMTNNNLNNNMNYFNNNLPNNNIFNVNNFSNNTNMPYKQNNQFQRHHVNKSKANYNETLNSQENNRRSYSTTHSKSNISVNITESDSSRPKKGYSRGLNKTIDGNCYMNAILQCLVHIKDLTNYFLANKNEINLNKDKYQLSNAFLEVIENLWKNVSGSYSPKKLKDLISKMNPTLLDEQKSDSKDFILFFLDIIHNELNQTNKFNQNFYDKDCHNFYKSLQNYCNYFINNYQSIISEIFYGLYDSQIICNNCKMFSHDIKFFNILLIPPYDVYKYKNRIGKYVTISECLEYYQKMKIEEIFCNNCKLCLKGENNYTLLIGPKVLIIDLKKSDNLNKEIRIDFDENINLESFFYFKNSSKYKLIGVISKYYQYGAHSQIISFCKSTNNNNWYKYNDSIVSLSSFNDIKKVGTPLIFFYSVEK